MLRVTYARTTTLLGRVLVFTFMNLFLLFFFFLMYFVNNFYKHLIGASILFSSINGDRIYRNGSEDKSIDVKKGFTEMFSLKFRI